MHLVTVKADLSRLPLESLEQKTGVDGEEYYKIEYEVEVTYYSAHTKCELIYDGKNYGAVKAEYV